MATAIDVDIDQQTDIDISLSEVSIDIDLGRCNDTDISVEVIGGNVVYGGMVEREVVWGKVAGATNGTHQATYNPTSHLTGGGTISYIVAIGIRPGTFDYSTGLQLSIPGSGITMTRVASVRQAGFPYNLGAGHITLYYYIGSVPAGDLTLQVTNGYNATVADGVRGYFFFGTTWGTPQYLGYYTNGAGDGSGGSNTYDPGDRIALPFQATTFESGTVLDLDSYTELAENPFLGRWATGNGYDMWGRVGLPEYLDDTLGDPFTLLGSLYRRVTASLVMTDEPLGDGPVGAYSLAAPLSISADIDHCTDMEIVVERGSCPESQPET